MSKRKILLIDDEIPFTELVRLNLEASGGFEVRVENNPVDAVQAALSFRPELILLDVIMPEVEGPDVLCQIQQEAVLKDIPIIFLTATVRKDEVIEQDGFIGGHPFLAKPCTVDDLIQAIYNYLP